MYRLSGLFAFYSPFFFLFEEDHWQFSELCISRLSLASLVSTFPSNNLVVFFLTVSMQELRMKLPAYETGIPALDGKIKEYVEWEKVCIDHSLMIILTCIKQKASAILFCCSTICCREKIIKVKH